MAGADEDSCSEACAAEAGSEKRKAAPVARSVTRRATKIQALFETNKMEGLVLVIGVLVWLKPARWQLFM